MTDQMKLLGPYRVEVQAHCTDGENYCVAKYLLGIGKEPTQEHVMEACTNAADEVREQLGENWRLCTKREFFDHLMAEMTRTDERFALPGGEEWDSP